MAAVFIVSLCLCRSGSADNTAFPGISGKIGEADRGTDSVFGSDIFRVVHSFTSVFRSSSAFDRCILSPVREAVR